MREGARATGDELLLERERELAAIDAMLERAAAGRGGVLVVEGEPGVGKSRLLLAGRAQAESAGIAVRSGRGSVLERSFAFGVAGQLLAASSADLPDLHLLGSVEADAAGAGLAVIHALHERLLGLVWERGRYPDGAPLLLAVDDAHAADEPSLRFLAYLTARIEELPVALIVALRSGERDGGEHVFDRMRDAAIQVLRPGLLSEAAATKIVGAVLGEEADPDLVAACLRASGGNPFYLRELLISLRADPGPWRPDLVETTAPGTVLRSVMVRLGRLGRAASELARAAAVLGDGTPLRLAASLAKLSGHQAEDAADALASASILRRGEPVRFLHPLIAAAVESDMGAFERARGHRRAAELLFAERAPADRIAPHLMIARPEGDRWVVEILEQAAAHALSAGAPAAAAGLLDRALREPPDPGERPQLLLASAKAEALAGSPQAADRLEQALEVIAEPESRAEALAELATLVHHRWDFSRAAELAGRAAAELPGEHPRRQRLLGIELAAALFDPQLSREAEARLEPIVTAARAGEPPTDGRLLALVVGVLGVADPVEIVRGLAEAAIAIDPLIDDSHGASLGWIGSALWWIDEFELAERWLDDAIETAERRGATIAGAIAALQRATARLHRGRLDGALADGLEAFEVARLGWTSWPWNAAVLATTHIARGDLDAARQCIATGNPADANPPDRSLLLEAEAKLQLAEGDPAAALESAQAAGEVSDQRYGNNQPRVREWRRLAARAADRLGRKAEARDLIEPELGVLREIGPARQLGDALTVAGLVAGGADGLALLDEAASVLESSPSQLQRTETLLELGAARRRAGKRTAAKEPLYQALQLAAEISAPALEQRARDELRRLGLRPRRSARTGVASLTPSERRVAELAAEGLSTPEIAYRLYVTRNTVETHLGHVYRKLEISGRGELPEALGESSG